MKKARIIYNPTSGRELAKKNIAYILDRLEDAGYEASAYATKGKGDATKGARKAVRRKFDLVVAAGGDGTINEVINGLAEREFRPRLGVLPLGTTNDFARAVGIPRDIVGACDVLCDGYEIPIDIGKVNNHYFVNMAGGGKLTELTYDVPSKLKTMLGQMAYYMKGIEMLPSLRPTKVRIDYDDRTFSGDIMLFLVSNTNSVGGFERLAPEAQLNDGVFDLIILKETNLGEFIRLASMAMRGEHMKDPKVIYAQASRIKVQTEEKMQLNLDGEYGGDLPGEIVNLYRHLYLMVPKELADTQQTDNRQEIQAPV
ncbi:MULTISPECIES: diacylglycerol kinase [unclassified Sporolactobacillus]|uniref:diacylglycerol kinase n=1 Tax=unclassified Sporolactobacillus TaxID=2628533 RepID=UPI0023681961|nr:diacylglycerol kinase [Sporolactobacillus sp. CQH2019]MDD9149744.1 diacylglycerol kinase [Sporolactobacillus sp. CQH2019]